MILSQGNLQTKKFLLMSLFKQSENYVACSFMNNFFELF